MINAEIVIDNVNWKKKLKNTKTKYAFYLDVDTELFSDTIKNLYTAIYFSDNLQLNVENNHEQSIPSVSTRTTTEDSLTGYNIYQALASGDSLVLATYGEDTTAVITVSENYVEYCFFIKARWHTVYGELESKATSTVLSLIHI